MTPHLDPSMTLGDLFTISTFIVAIAGAYYGLKGQLEVFRSELSAHGETLNAHADKMDEHDSAIKDVFGKVERILGRLEVQTERRTHPRGSHGS